MYIIEKEFHFSASHQLIGLPEEHPCSRLHGHNYRVRVTLQSETLNEVGFVRDYRDLDKLKKVIDVFYDHRHLNDVMDVNPTAENMAEIFYWIAKDRCPEVVEVAVSETDKTWARYFEYAE